MAYCPNTSLKEWKDLVSAQGKKLAYFLWDKYKGNVPSMFYVNSQGVSYTPRVVSALLKAFENRKTIRVATDGQKTNIRKYLAGQGVPSEQIDLMFSYLDYTNQTEVKTDDLIVDMLSSYSYAIEINTAKKTIGVIGADRSSLQFNIENSNYSSFKHAYLDEFVFTKDGKKITEEEYNTARSAFQKNYDASLRAENANYYSNLTVPGGTNYTEQEIATPEITPNIKGHAQFATDKGIGWHRADDRIIDIQKMLDSGLIKQVPC